MAGSLVQYSLGGTPIEQWATESAWFKIAISDSLAGRLRVLNISIANPTNIKDSVYTSYRRIRITDANSSKVVFLGRVIAVKPSYDSQYGQIITVSVADYIEQLFERQVDADYRVTPGAVKRSALIAQIVTTYGGAVTQDIEVSGSSSTVTKDYTKSGQTPIQLIEMLATEDYWTNETWGALWRYNTTSYDNDTSSGSFYFLGASNHYFYFGQNNPFLGADFTLSAPYGSYGAQTWQYWDGTTWTNLTITTAYNFTTATGSIRWDLKADWVTAPFSATWPHVLAPIDTTSRYWVRCCVASVTDVATVTSIICARGCGYDYYVDDSQIFHYFRRGSKPVSGPESAGLTIELTGTIATSTRPLNYDYSFYSDPKEIVTRVVVYGTANDGSTITSVETKNAALETSLGVVKEKVDYVWGSDMDPATLQTYCNERAKALLSMNDSEVTRGEFSFYQYPYFGVGKTLVRVGDLVHIIISTQGIDDDFIVLEVNYEEPIGITKMKVVSMVWGRTFSPFELTSVLQGLSSGQNISVATARIQDLIVDDARIANMSVTKLLAGAITVGITTGTGGSIGSRTPGGANLSRVALTPEGIKSYDTAGTQRVQILSDGSGWLGSSSSIFWGADGSLTVDALKVSGTLSAATIAAENINAGSFVVSLLMGGGGSLKSAATGQRVEIIPTGIDVYGGKFRILSMDASPVTQVETDATGRLTAGVGTVILSVSGIQINGQKLILANSAGVGGAAIYLDDSFVLRLDSWSYAKIKSLYPVDNNARNLGSAADVLWWWNAYITNVNSQYIFTNNIQEYSAGSGTTFGTKLIASYKLKIPVGTDLY
jgi:hypothetical protein